MNPTRVFPYAMSHATAFCDASAYDNNSGHARKTVGKVGSAVASATSDFKGVTG